MKKILEHLETVRMNRKRLWKIIGWNVILFCVLIVIYTALNLITDEGCPIYLLTHIRCPMCGMTRAHLAALRLDFETAFAYHPFFILGIPYILLLINRDYFSKRWRRVSDIVTVLITVLLLGRYLFVLLSDLGIASF